MGKHTPGPWECYSQDWRVVVDNGGEVIADVRSMEDDARLIAAAPELLGAAREAEAFLMGKARRDSMERQIVELLSAAIAKATGK